jgi:recX family
MSPFNKTITPEAARIRMADLCARSEQCEADIRQKLYRLGLASGEVQKIIESLTLESFIDNARFARSFARDKCRFSSWGRNKIRLALAAKRISPQDIAQGLEAIEEKDYLDALRRVAAAKARGLDLTGPDGRENRIKLFRHILSRGFESDLATKAIKELLK